MDPDTCFADFKLAISEGRGDDAAEHARDLIEWLDGGGFEPRDSPPDLRIWLDAHALK